MNGSKTGGAIQWWVLVVLIVLIPVSVAAVVAPSNFVGLEIQHDEEPSFDAEFPEPVVLEFISVTRWTRGLPGDPHGAAGMVVGVYGYDEKYVYQHGKEAKYGLRLEATGDYPRGLWFPEHPVVLEDAERIYIPWNDGDTRSDRIDVTVTATWVDRYGREGPTSDPARLIHGGNSRLFFLGCSTVGGGGAPSGLLAALLIVAALRLRRLTPS